MLFFQLIDLAQGDGLIKIEMHFLADVYVECDQCRGRRYNRETLEILFKQKNISEFTKKCLHEAGVAIVPGTAFGKTAVDYVRFSFAASQDNISKALEKIRKMLD